MKKTLDKQDSIPYIKSMDKTKENEMTTLKIDFAMYLSEKELKEIREYVSREFSYNLEDKLILVVSEWLDKVKDIVKEENKVIEEMEREDIEAMMKAREEAGIKTHEGGYPNLEVS